MSAELKVANELRLLAASMRHSAGQWMVPGWDGHKVADLLQQAQSALQAKEAEIAALKEDAELMPEPKSALRDDFEAWKRTQNDGYDAWGAVLWATEMAEKKIVALAAMYDAVYATQGKYVAGELRAIAAAIRGGGQGS